MAPPGNASLTPPGTSGIQKKGVRVDGDGMMRSQSDGALQKPSTAGATALLPSAARQASRRVSSLSEHPELELRFNEPEFEEDHPLIKQLRAIFDWMAQERNAKVVSHRKFTHRLPELHRRMPQIATSFRHMDRNGDGWLQWGEFSSFCLKDQKLMHDMRHSTTVQVYARERDGRRTNKDLLDPVRMCEVGSIPPLLAWETSHVVEWRVDNLNTGTTPGAPMRHGPTIIRPGTALASPQFRAAGICGVLKFWPSGYWSEAQQRAKRAHAAPHISFDEQTKGPHPMPSPDAWCGIGLSVPAGTHLVFRFFVGDFKSEKRECFWHDGNFPGTIWAPAGMKRPVMHLGDSVTCGIEIFANKAGSHPPKHHKQQGVKNRTAFIRDNNEGAQAFKEAAERMDLKSMSLPALPDSTTWRNLDKLLQEQRRTKLAPNRPGMDRQRSGSASSSALAYDNKPTNFQVSS